MQQPEETVMTLVQTPDGYWRVVERGTDANGMLDRLWALVTDPTSPIKNWAYRSAAWYDTHREQFPTAP